MKKLSHTDEMTCTTDYWKLSWQVAELDLSVGLSDAQTLDLL